MAKFTVWSWILPQSDRVGWIPPLGFLILITRRKKHTVGEEDLLSPQPLNVLRRSVAVTPVQCHYNPSTTSVPVRKQVAARNMFKNKIAWKQWCKREIKERHVKRKTRKYVFPLDSRCCLWHTVIFPSSQAPAQSWALRPGFFFLFWGDKIDFKRPLLINENRKDKYL